MKLNDNPIFLTQKRLIHRGGVLAAVLIAALIGLSLFSGLVAYLAEPLNFDFRSPQDAGKMFYGWIIGVEILVLVIGGFSRISNTLANERKAGLWDSNRLTPLRPSQLVTGYWFGAPLREFYMAVVLAGIGLAIVLLGRLSPMLWMGTQILIFSTALFFGLLAVLAGLVVQRTQNGLALIVVFFFFQFPSFAAPKFLITNFLLPIFGIANFFRITSDAGNSDVFGNWNGLPSVFNLPIYPLLLSLALQLLIGVFVWRAVIRKTANPFLPLMLHWEAVALFAILIVVQQGLVWGIWDGTFPMSVNHRFRDGFPLLSGVHGGTILVAMIFLGFSSQQPENVRVQAMRLGVKNLGAIFSGSAVSLALGLAAVAAAALLTQCAFSLGNSWEIYLIAIGNLLSVFVIFALLLEFCRLRFRRRALGFVALWLFVLCALPFILAAVFTSGGIARLSLLAPGVIALADPDNENLNNLLGIVGGHLGIAFLLFLAWQQQWKQLLAKASAAQN